MRGVEGKIGHVDTVSVRDVDGVALVTLQRPPANAMAPDLVADALAALDQLERDRPAAVVLAGSGGFFCAGADLRLVPELPPDDQAAMARDVNRLYSGWHALPRPLVCAVTGHAVAGGLVWALCGDHRVVSTSGRFGLTEVKVGIPYPSAAMAVVRAELAPPVARRLVLRGELFDAAAATALGVFDEQVADDAVVGRALEVARELAALPARTYEVVKARLKNPDAAERLFGGADAAASVLAEAREAAPRALLGDDG